MVKARIRVNLSTMMFDKPHFESTWLVGYLPFPTRYDQVVKVFGNPMILDMPDKVKVNWIGKINDLVFTIYDYKSPVEPEQNMCWHIGGKNELTGQLVLAYFKEALKSKKEGRK